MSLRNSLLSLVLLLFAISNINAQQSVDQIIDISKTIKADDFKKHLFVLADDSLKGRNTSSKGFDIAANYVVNNLEEIGAKPGGENNSYFQKVPFINCSYAENSLKVDFNAKNMMVHGVYGENFTTLVPTKAVKVNDNQKLVFVGNGIVDKKRNINDYANVDVKGKTVIIEATKPKYLKDVHETEIFNPLNLVETAVEQGASGVIMFIRIGAIQKLAIRQMHASLSSFTFAVDNMEKGNPMLSYDIEIGMIAHKDIINALFKAEGKNLNKYIKDIQKGEQRSFELDASIKFEYEITAEEKPCKNVIAVVPGTDPVLKDEYIVVSAHLDHVGVGRAIKNDSIYNGAWDNASGSAGILSLVKIFEESPVKPKRSIMFIWFTGEEKGLLGSYYFTHYPTVEKEKIVADINLDMMGGFFEAKNILPIGYEMSNMSEAVDFACKTLKLGVNDTSAFLTEYFERSDHYSFIEQGIPGIFVWRGLDARDPKINGYKTYKKYERKTLHSPFDDLSQDFDNKAFLTSLKLHYLTTAYLANEIEKIEWNTDSELYKKYILKEEDKENE